MTDDLFASQNRTDEALAAAKRSGVWEGGGGGPDRRARSKRA